MKKFVIPLTDYCRIHRVAHGVIEQLSSPEKSCIFFSIFGAYILKHVYKINARPVAGAFVLCVDDEPSVASFGKLENDLIISDSEGFHMWVQTEHHIVDFMSPLFSKSFAKKFESEALPPKMFQKLQSTEAESALDLKVVGDFITYPNLDLTHILMAQFLERNDTQDLVQVAETWFGKRRGKTQKHMAMQNDLGEVYKLALPTIKIQGSW